MINLSVIQLIKTEGIEHEEEIIFTADLDFYPSYKAGDTLFLEDNFNQLKQSIFVVVDVHHLLRTRGKSSANTVTLASMYVYVRIFD